MIDDIADSQRFQNMQHVEFGPQFWQLFGCNKEKLKPDVYEAHLCLSNMPNKLCPDQTRLEIEGSEWTG